MVIRAVVAHGVALLRGALVFVLSTEDDIEVVADLDRVEDVVPAVVKHKPDVAVVDLDLIGPAGLRAINPECPCNVLVLAEARRFSGLVPLVSQPGCRVGFLANDGSPGHLIDAVRRAAKGERVIDPDLVLSALTKRCPLTSREIEVLCVTAQGGSVKEIARILSLSPGTVRNHLSHILAKTGARSRLEAVSMARETGWI